MKDIEVKTCIIDKDDAKRIRGISDWLKAKFEAAEHNRNEINKRVVKAVNDRQLAVEFDIQNEAKNRYESI